VCVDSLAVDERLDDEQGIECGLVRLITVCHAASLPKWPGPCRGPAPA
jgi:hypothetical protein